MVESINDLLETVLCGAAARSAAMRFRVYVCACVLFFFE